MGLGVLLVESHVARKHIGRGVDIIGHQEHEPAYSFPDPAILGESGPTIRMAEVLQLVRHPVLETTDHPFAVVLRSVVDDDYFVTVGGERLLREPRQGYRERVPAIVGSDHHAQLDQILPSSCLGMVQVAAPVTHSAIRYTAQPRKTESERLTDPRRGMTDTMAPQGTTMRRTTAPFSRKPAPLFTTAKVMTGAITVAASLTQAAAASPHR